MLNTMEAYSGLADVRIEGIEVIAVRYKTIVDGTKKKNYDILDHRKPEVSCRNLALVVAILLLLSAGRTYHIFCTFLFDQRNI